MPRGHPKKLPYLKALEGNPSKRAIDALGVDAQGEPFIPEHLSDDARGCIDVIRRSMPMRVYSALDSFLLAAFATAWGLHKRAAHEVNRPGFQAVIVTPNGAEMQSAWVSLLNTQAKILVSLGARLGLDPVVRASLHLPNARQQKSKFDGLIGRPANERLGRH
jgi:phage terminase small subunit